MSATSRFSCCWSAICYLLVYFTIHFTILCTEAEDIASEELELEGKKITIDLKSNDQGKFMKIIETQQGQTRGRIIFSAEKAFEFRSILNEFVAEYERLPPAEETADSERLKTYVLKLFLP